MNSGSVGGQSLDRHPAMPAANSSLLNPPRSSAHTALTWAMLQPFQASANRAPYIASKRANNRSIHGSGNADDFGGDVARLRFFGCISASSGEFV